MKILISILTFFVIHSVNVIGQNQTSGASNCPKMNLIDDSNGGREYYCEGHGMSVLLFLNQDSTFDFFHLETKLTVSSGIWFTQDDTILVLYTRLPQLCDLENSTGMKKIYKTFDLEFINIESFTNKRFLLKGKALFLIEPKG